MIDERRLLAELREFPLDWNIRFQLIDLYQSRGAQRDVLGLIDGATRPPTDLNALKKIIDLCVWANEPSVAWRPMDDYLRDHPDSARGHYLMTKLLVKLGNLALARRHYHRAINLDPELEDDVLADKIASVRRSEASDPVMETPFEPVVETHHELEPAFVSGAPPSPNRVSAKAPRPFAGRPALIPQIDAKTERVKLPPPLFRVAEEPEPSPPAWQAPPAQEIEPASEPYTYPSQEPYFQEYEVEEEPVPQPVYQTPPPAPQQQTQELPPLPPSQFPPVPVETQPAAATHNYDEPAPAPFQQARFEPVYEEEPAPVNPFYQPRPGSGYEEPAPMEDVAPPGSAAPENGWDFLQPSQQPQRGGRKRRQKRAVREGNYRPRRRKSAPLQVALIVLLIGLGHASIFLAPQFLVSDISEPSSQVASVQKP